MPVPRAALPLINLSSISPSLRTTLPPIVKLPSASTGNNKPKSLRKTRRTWHCNVQRVDMPVRVLETGPRRGRASVSASTTSAAAAATSTTPTTPSVGGSLLGVKMRMRDLRGFEKHGGVEGTLLARKPSDLTEFGKQLRSELFERLMTMRDEKNKLV